MFKDRREQHRWSFSVAQNRAAVFILPSAFLFPLTIIYYKNSYKKKNFRVD